MSVRDHIRLRARTGGVSGLRRCLFLALFVLPFMASVAGAALVINEIMYHPRDGWQNNAGNWVFLTNKTEYIEVYNSSTNAVALSNYRFDNGVDYQFPTGAQIAATSYAVVCENVMVFTGAYPTATTYYGNYNGALNNGGERVTLSRYDGTNWVTADTIQYVDGGLADGDGYSLELVNPGLAGASDQYFGAWKCSTSVSGTPGRVNSVFTNTPAPVIGNVSHDPPLPPTNSTVTITAHAMTYEPSHTLSVTLWYRRDANPQGVWSNAVMYDNGLNGDETAGDGIYSRQYPAYGQTTTNGELLEFKIAVLDNQTALTNIAPGESTSGATNSSLSYFCYFGEDTNFTGEYKTFHILMTKVNRATLEANYQHRIEPLDCTFITSDGKVFYNSGVSYRGDNSRTSYNPAGNGVNNYQISLPRGNEVGGMRTLNFNHENGLQNYLGLLMQDRAGEGYDQYAPDPALRRLWINETSIAPGEGIFCQIQAPEDIVADHFNDDSGNYYAANGSQQLPEDPTRDGDLSLLSSLSAYTTEYVAWTNNPTTIWSDISNLTWTIDQNAAQPFVLTNRMKVRGWARVYAAAVGVHNKEAGYTAPLDVRGDELRMYCDPEDGRFTIFPWDYSNEFISDGSIGAVWDWNYSIVRKFLFGRPMVPFYVGDCLDVIDNVMSVSNMTAIFDGMGSALSSAKRTEFSNTVTSCRTSLHTKINTNLTVTVSNAVAQGSLATIVSSATVALYGQAPQNYTDSLRINGVYAGWKSYSVAAMQTEYGLWTTTNSLALTGTVNRLLVETLDSYGNVLRTTNLTIVARTNFANTNGTISANTTWNNANGAIIVTSDVTVNNSAVLTVASNTMVLFNSGTKINVTAGTLKLAGTSTKPVWMFPADGSSAWAITASGGGSLVTGSYVELSGGRVSVTNGASLSLENSKLSCYAGADGIIAAAGTTTLYRCTVSDFAKTRFEAAPALITECLFERMTDAGMEFAVGTATVSRTTVRTSTGTGAQDGIRILAGARGLVTNCMVNGITGNGILINGAGATGTVCRGLVYGCSTGVSVAVAGAVTNYNNTIVGCNIGIIGTPQVAHSLIVWSNTVASISNGPAAITNSDVELAGINTYAGTANINRYPWFRDEPERDYRLLTNKSPCIGTGLGGTNMGASFPVGACPAAPDNLVITNISASNLTLQWRDNSGSEEAWFEVERSADGVTWAYLTNAAANATNYPDAGLIQNTLYWYRVLAAHERGDSLYSEEQSATTTYATTATNLQAALRFTEIMYNPKDSGGSLHEFMELKNIGATELDLTGLFMDGSRFAFTNNTKLAAGGFFVLVWNPTSFTNWYTNVTYRGVFSNNALSDAGETLWIKDASGTKVVEVQYADGWYPITDGNNGEGHSLVINEAGGSQTNATGWRASTNPRGSPGSNDPVAQVGVVINELLSHQDADNPGDWIELYNPTVGTVNMTNWYLSDSPANLKMYQIKPGDPRAVIPAGGYVVFNEHDDFGTNAAPTNAFALSELGEEIYLSSADTSSNLTSYRASATFGAGENGVTFGRYTRSDGEVDFTAMSNATSLASNSYPKVGPVVINEIMYNPAAGGLEYVEVLNITSSNVPLFDPAYPTNTWLFNGAMEYTFPTNTTLTNGEYALLVGTTPAEFRARFGVEASIRIFGPYNGDLANNGETLKLYKPNSPELDSFVPYVLVDKVQYDDNLPWPAAADNGGAALERIAPRLYGNDPANWLAQTVGGTPGATNKAAGVPAVAFGRAVDSGYESSTTVNVAVVLSPESAATVTVSYAVSGGTATNGSDYNLAAGSLVFWPYDTQKIISLQIVADGVSNEPDETVVIALSNQSANACMGGNRLYTYTIIDTNTGTLAAPAISPAGTNNFFGNIAVTITTTVANAMIYYTTDGSVPTRDDHLYTNQFTLTASARIKARTFLGSYHEGDTASALFVEQTSPWDWGSNTVYRLIGASGDDAYQYNQSLSKRVDTTSTSIDVGVATNQPNLSGFRFTNIAIPRGATISNAYLQFTTAAITTNPVTMKIFGEKTNDAKTFVSGNTTNISNRFRTTNYVAWTPAGWTVDNEQGFNQQTTNISSVVAEIVSQTNWSNGNALAIILVHTNAPWSGKRSAWAYDGDQTKAAVLWVEFSPPAGSDSDSDGLPDWWELSCFGGLTNENGSGDADTDGFLNTEEYIANTDPTNPLSFFQIDDMAVAGSNGVVYWLSATGRSYAVYGSTNLMGSWPVSPLTNIAGSGTGTNSYQDADSTNMQKFYQIKVQLQ